jgi:hypothetical protein
MGQLPRNKRRRLAARVAVLREGTLLLDAARLAAHYALMDTMIGWGKFEQPKDLLAGRVMLLSSMEVFIIAHEIAHFAMYEAYPDTAGVSPGGTEKDLELACDLVGLNVCTMYGKEEGNAFAFQLVGPLLFFYSLRICSQARSILKGTARESESHPSPEERMRLIYETLGVAKAKLILRRLDEVLDMAMIIGSHVQLLVEDFQQRASSHTSR